MSAQKKNWQERICLFLLFLSASFAICYWAIAKYDVQTDLESSDARMYIKMSQSDFDGVARRFQYRILMPLMVRGVAKATERMGVESFLSKYFQDVDRKMAQLHFGIINILALTGTAFALFYYGLRFGFSKFESLAGSFIYLTSFFTVNYFSITLVDSLSCFFLMTGFYAIVSNSIAGLFVSLVLGALAKETIFVLVLAVLISKQKLRKEMLGISALAVFLYALYIFFFPIKTVDDGVYIFSVLSNVESMNKSLRTFLGSFNFYSLLEYIEVFSFGWVLFVYALLRCSLPAFLKRTSWLLLLPLIMTPLQSVGANGRVTFYLFPIVIPCALFGLRQILSRNDTSPEEV